MRHSIRYAAMSSVLAGCLLMAGTAFADQGTSGHNDTEAPGHGWAMGTVMAGAHMGGTRPVVVGIVSTINGSTLTVTAKTFGRPSEGSNGQGQSGTIYTVNASSATVFKNNATSTLSSVAVGDTVLVQGTLSGTTVTATAIRDGMFTPKAPGQYGTPAAPFQGNGQPIVGGTVSTISGSTLTITNKGTATYSVDGSNATVRKGNATSTLSAITVGDMVLVQGTINGSSVTATTILDQGAPKVSDDGSATSTAQNGPGMKIGQLFGGLGNFFKHLFGF